MPFADLTDVRCRYEIMGHGDPLLMINGLGSTCEKWGQASEVLAKSFTVITVDNPGMGESIAKRTPQTLSDLAANFVDLFDYLQLDRAHVLGLSFGGIIAQRVAIDHPSRVDRFVLVSTANRFGPYLAQITQMLSHTLQKYPYEIFRKTMEVFGMSPEFYDAHSAEIARAVAGECNTKEHSAAIARQLACLACQEVAPPSEYRIHSPTLVIAGEQDLLIPQSYARRMADEIANSEFVSIKSCGHDPFLEKPSELLATIVNFLFRSHSDASHNTKNHKNRMHEVKPVMEDVT